MAEGIVIARDASVILLAIESIILFLLPLYLLLKATQGLRKLLPQVRPFVRQVHTWADKGYDVIRSAMRALAWPFAALQAAAAALEAFRSAYRRRSG